MSSEVLQQDEFPLLHLVELVLREPLFSSTPLSPPTEPPNSCAIVRRLHPDDATVLGALKSEDVQSWCLSRIAEYQAVITVVRDQPDLAMYNATVHEFAVRHKSHMWALRSVYNAGAPIHRRLPPEILLEIFSNLHHDGTRHGPPALRVCHYWHTLLQRIPQLWQTLLTQEFLVKWDPQWKVRRFAAAISRSAPLDLSLRLRGIDHAVLDVLAPHSHRLISMTFLTIGYSDEFEPLDRLLQLDMPKLRCLDICRWTFLARFTKSCAALLLKFPHLQTLRLASMHLGPPEAPHTSLRHLELMNCWESITPSSHIAMSLHTLLAIIRKCPNLETLCVRRIEGELPRNKWLDSGSLVNVSRLRRLTLQESRPESTLALLSHLVLPVTTVLDIEPILSHAEALLQLPTSVVTPFGRPPVAEVTLRVRSTIAKNTTTWETQGEGSRPLRLSMTLYDNHRLPDAILGRTNEVLSIFAPGTAVTSLTITSGRSWRPEDFWTGLLAGLPNLAHLLVDCDRAGDYPVILPLLGRPQGDGGFLCPALTNVSVLWDPQSDPEEWPELVAETTQARMASASVGPSSHPRSAATAPRVYCRALQHYLRSRAEHGCLPLKAISVSIWNRGCGTAMEAELREGLKDLVEEVSVGSRSK